MIISQGKLFVTGLTMLFCSSKKFKIPARKQVKINYFLSNFLAVTLNHETKSRIGDPKRKETISKTAIFLNCLILAINPVGSTLTRPAKDAVSVSQSFFMK